VIRSADGRAERMLGVNIDITERKLANEALKSALAEVQTLKDRLQQENVYLQEEIRVASNFGEMIGESESLKRVQQLAEQVAPLDTTVLILGETGTGKELLAHAIHNRSPRHNRTLVKVNCATLPGELIESELFGHEKGAFTGASARRIGRFELANNGTIFLDEVGELPLDLQAKLLRVLQEGEFDPVGSSRTVTVDVRVIAATNRDLEKAVRHGLFRDDLYYRLSIFPITSPPLRERPKDIQLLVKHFVQEFSRKFGKNIEVIPQETMNALKNYPWPGNVRELRNVIERAVIIAQGSKLSLDSLEALKAEPKSAPGEDANIVGGELISDGTETLEQSQYNLIVQTLKKTYWRIEGPYGAAAALNVHPSTLRSLMKKLGISRPKVKTGSISTGRV
jgi:formate hydrogenlyase transcriptional activator